MTNPSIVKKPFKCKEEDCDGPYNHGRGYCTKHYKRFMKYGNAYCSQRNPNDIIVKRDSIWIILRDNNYKETGRTIIDSIDYDLVKGYKWHLSSSKYAVTNVTSSRVVTMGHIILGITSSRSIMIDHKNRRPLDNKRQNLRKCSNLQNSQNQKLAKNNTSGFKGVNQRPKGKWQSSIRTSGKGICLGTFENKIDAARAYDQAAVKYFGEFAAINSV